VRFAISPNDLRLVQLVAHFDRPDHSAAETWRQVSLAAERVGLNRPSYQHIRRLVRIERRLQELRAQRREVWSDAAARNAAGLVPSVAWTLSRVRELQRAEELVVQEHKPLEAPDERCEAG
jgi:hypothetical protein